MTEIVEPLLRQRAFRQGSVEVPNKIARADGCAASGRENEVPVLPIRTGSKSVLQLSGSMSPKRIHRNVGKRNCPTTLLGLGLHKFEPSVDLL